MIWSSHKSNGLLVFYSSSVNPDVMPGPLTFIQSNDNRYVQYIQIYTVFVYGNHF